MNQPKVLSTIQRLGSTAKPFCCSGRWITCSFKQPFLRRAPTHCAKSGPAAKVIINGLPRTKILGEHPPSTAGAHQIKDAIDHLARVGGGTPAPFAFG